MIKSIFTKCKLSLGTLASVVALVATSGGCSSSNGVETVTPKVELINRSSQALSTGALLWANGTYGGCFGHTNGDPWSLRIGGSAPMTNAALSVTKNDASCVLTLAELVADETYESTPDIAMDAAYKATASQFAVRVLGALEPVAFYANAKLNATDMASDFTVTILYSDNLSDASPSVSATYAQFSGATTGTQVPVPNYAMTFNLTIQTDLDAIVSSASGTVDLIEGNQLGENYVIVAGSVGSTFADVDAAFRAGTPTAIGASIAASEVTLGGATLPVVRTLIIAHTVTGVPAYQVIRMTFNSPP